jgi:hypothetical protein
LFRDLKERGIDFHASDAKHKPIQFTS